MYFIFAFGEKSMELPSSEQRHCVILYYAYIYMRHIYYFEFIRGMNETQLWITTTTTMIVNRSTTFTLLQVTYKVAVLTSLLKPGTEEGLFPPPWWNWWCSDAWWQWEHSTTIVYDAMVLLCLLDHVGIWTKLEYSNMVQDHVGIPTWCGHVGIMIWHMPHISMSLACCF